MNPKEFDDLLRKKFDQNDFAYSPQNWDKLAEQLDGRAKKRSVIVWWWAPLVGLAASVVMGMGIISLVGRQSTATGRVNTEYAQTHRTINGTAVTSSPEMASVVKENKHKTKKARNKPLIAANPNEEDWFNIQLQNALAGSNAKTTKTFDLLNAGEKIVKKKTDAEPPHPTFKEEAIAKKEPKISLILSGGLNHGALNSGYVAGATVRRMISDKVFVESDLGYASSTNSQTNDLSVPTTRSVSIPLNARTAGAAAKTSSVESGKAATEQVTTYSNEVQNETYTLNYAQVSPSIGVKIIKRMSLAAGPDFQQMLGDNRPAISPLDRASVQEAPLFDVGVMGKTEYAVSKKLKAGVYYRKGINDLISPSDKYINRDYMQFQLKWVIFNK